MIGGSFCKKKKNHIFDKELVLKYVENSYNSTWVQDLNKCFSKDDTQMAANHMKILSFIGRKGKANKTSQSQLTPAGTVISTRTGRTGWGVWRSCHPLVGAQNGAAAPPMPKHRVAAWPPNSAPT